MPESAAADGRAHLRAPLTVAVLVLPIVVTQALSLQYAAPLALFITVVVLWFTELLPLAVTGLLVPVLAVLFGVSAAKEAFLPFGNQILFLFLGVFLLAQAMQKHGWDRRMAYFILSRRVGATSPGALIVVVSLVCWVLSMWVSNTATTAIMAPICLGVITTLAPRFEMDREKRNFALRLLLTCAFASSIGGMATPVGSPPNMLAIQFLRERGIDINFLEWVIGALPVSLTMLVVLHLILGWRYPSAKVDLHGVRAQFAESLRELGALRREEIQVAACFLLAVLLWVLPGIAELLSPALADSLDLSNRLPMGVVALLAAILLFILPASDGNRNLEWRDAQNIDWGTILLFGGGLCLGSILDKSGLAALLGELLFGSLNSFLLSGMFAVVLGILMSEFSSNTASTSVVVPILIGAFAGIASQSLVCLVVATAFGASFGFMLPVSTPPNAIIYGTGRVPLREMIRSGVFFDIAGLIVISVLVVWLYPLFGVWAGN